MGSFIDLTGQKFGQLTAIQYLGKRHWTCTCECGASVQVRADHLKKGETVSCGCIRAHQDLSGQKFGEWVVLKRLENDHNGAPMYLCQCSCGAIAHHQASNLLFGSTASCGCAPRWKDCSGSKIGRLTVLQRLPGEPSYYICQCDCGTYKRILATNLHSGKTHSCGCLASELTSERMKSQGITHGKAHSRIYKIWCGMLQRCLNPNSSSYHYYGGRGIAVDVSWLDFENFYNDMGDPPSDRHSIDRVQVNGNYEKSNVRWATAKQQANNRRNNISK